MTRVRRASSSQPGRSAWRATSRASRGKRSAHRRTPRLAPPSGCLPGRPPMSKAGKESFSTRFGVRRHRLRDERPPAVSQHANVGQNLLSLFLGHFALRVRQLIEALLDLRPKLSAADFAVVLQGRLPSEARAFELRRNQIARNNDRSRDQNNNYAHLQRELRETLGGRGGDRVGNGDRG